MPLTPLARSSGGVVRVGRRSGGGIVNVTAPQPARSTAKSTAHHRIVSFVDPDGTLCFVPVVGWIVCVGVAAVYAAAIALTAALAAYEWANYQIRCAGGGCTIRFPTIDLPWIRDARAFVTVSVATAGRWTEPWKRCMTIGERQSRVVAFAVPHGCSTMPNLAFWFPERVKLILNGHWLLTQMMQLKRLFDLGRAWPTNNSKYYRVERNMSWWYHPRTDLPGWGGWWPW